MKGNLPVSSSNAPMFGAFRGSLFVLATLGLVSRTKAQIPKNCFDSEKNSVPSESSLRSNIPRNSFLCSLAVSEGRFFRLVMLLRTGQGYRFVRLIDRYNSEPMKDILDPYNEFDRGLNRNYNAVRSKSLGKEKLETISILPNPVDRNCYFEFYYDPRLGLTFYTTLYFSSTGYEMLKMFPRPFSGRLWPVGVIENPGGLFLLTLLMLEEEVGLGLYGLKRINTSYQKPFYVFDQIVSLNKSFRIVSFDTLRRHIEFSPVLLGEEFKSEKRSLYDIYGLTAWRPFYYGQYLYFIPWNDSSAQYYIVAKVPEEIVDPRLHKSHAEYRYYSPYAANLITSLWGCGENPSQPTYPTVKVTSDSGRIPWETRLFFNLCIIVWGIVCFLPLIYALLPQKRTNQGVFFFDVQAYNEEIDSSSPKRKRFRNDKTSPEKSESSSHSNSHSNSPSNSQSNSKQNKR